MGIPADFWTTPTLTPLRQKPRLTPSEAPLATKRQKGVETGSSCGPSADPSKSPLQGRCPTPT